MTISVLVESRAMSASMRKCPEPPMPPIPSKFRASSSMSSYARPLISGDCISKLPAFRLDPLTVRFRLSPMLSALRSRSFRKFDLKAILPELTVAMSSPLSRISRQRLVPSAIYMPGATNDSSSRVSPVSMSRWKLDVSASGFCSG